MNVDRFKFRVWDVLKRKYCNDEVAIRQDGTAYIGECMLEREYFRIEQCAGLHDKNGKLIYEGDRVESHDMFDDLYVFNVEWFQGKMVLRSTPNSAPVLVWDSLSYEIIGNIHEKEGAK